MRTPGHWCGAVAAVALLLLSGRAAMGAAGRSGTITFGRWAVRTERVSSGASPAWFGTASPAKGGPGPVYVGLRIVAKGRAGRAPRGEQAHTRVLDVKGVGKVTVSVVRTSQPNPAGQAPQAECQWAL